MKLFRLNNSGFGEIFPDLASYPDRRKVLSTAYELVQWPDYIRFQIYDVRSIGNANIKLGKSEFRTN